VRREGISDLGNNRKNRATILTLMRTSLRGKLSESMKTTPQSIIYRRKAAELGRMAEAEPEEEKMLPLLAQALSWIQLAENEELLGSEQIN
jgi:hypothetical protein